MRWYTRGMAGAQKTNKTRVKRGFIDTLFIGVLLVIFGGIVLHAPISVGLGTLWPDYSLLIKSWKEILLGFALVLSIIATTKQKAWQLFYTPLFWCIGGFAVLNLLLIPLFYTGFEATVAGLFINLRYLLFFVLVYVALKLYPHTYRLFLNVFIGGALVVIIFAVLQVTVLPHDVLKYLGYGKSTIMPFLTVDENIDYIRINSTLRGPNPLGAYAVVVVSMVLALWLRGPKKLTKLQVWLVGILGAGSVIALWASYSRSAALALIVAVAVVVMVLFGKRISKALWVAIAIVVLALCGSLVVLRDTPFVSQVILHEDPSEGNNINSNDGHAESLIEGMQRMVAQPLGGGIGSTGSASLLSDTPFIVENQYLFIAHEVGWLGLVLFVIIYYLVMKQLWHKRHHWFSLGVFASGLGLALIGLLLPVWADETVALIWWGLAAVALGSTKGVSRE